MAEIHAHGAGSADRARIPLEEGQLLRIGRAPQRGWSVPWDPMISREHADIYWEGERLRVRCVESARNPILIPDGCCRELHLHGGQSFRIGNTTFTLVVTAAATPELAAVTPTQQSSPAPANPAPRSLDDDDCDGILAQQTYTQAELQRMRFGNAEKQIELLARLPHLISTTTSDEQLAHVLVRLLLDAIPQAEAAAVVRYDPTEAGRLPVVGEAGSRPAMMRIETRSGFAGRFQPSQRLVAKSLHEQRSVVQIWGGESNQRFTISEGLGWAFAAPVPGDSCSGWCLYVSGKGGRDGAALVDETQLAGDLRFTELVAQFIGSIRQVRLLQEHRTQLGNFFSPRVVDTLISGRHADVLTPAERDIAVLFCDVRGFSRKAEELRNQLASLLDSVRAALSVMVDCIVERDGTIADLQGDAALGFWGWPLPLQDGPLPACRAALAIDAEFRRRLGPLQDFAIGVGIAYGSALAGQIGTSHHPKLGVFGPVVNQGARLEGMTRQFGVSICLDAATAEAVRSGMPPSEARLRCLGRVLPSGMKTPLTAYALLPPEQVAPEFTPDLLEAHAAAVEAVTQGRWTEAARVLDTLPKHDGPTAFLAAFLDRHHHTTPPDWDGVIRLTAK